MKRVLFFLLLTLVSLNHAFGQDDDGESEDYTYPDESTHDPINPADVSAREGYTHDPIQVKRFDSERWRGVTRGKNYRQKPSGSNAQQRRGGDGPDGGAAGERGKRYRGSGDDEEEDDGDISMSPLNSPLLGLLFYAIMIGLIVWIAWLILKNVSFRYSGKVRQRSTPGQEATTVEDIKELEIDRLLREALAAGDYRLVVRIYFLELLQKLDQDGFITWKKDKTNRDYLSELFAKAHYYDEVRSLTLAYEQVWYGDHHLSNQTYTRVIASFKNLNERLKTSAPQ